MDFKPNIPIYLQLIEYIELQIISGNLSAGEKLMSVRDLALKYGVNPNTMQKALGELEHRKLVYTVRTAGRYVTEDNNLIQQIRKEAAERKLQQMMEELQQMGYSSEEIKELVENYLKEVDRDDSAGTI